MYIGVDIGGTNTVIGVFDEQINLLKKTVVPTKRSNVPKVGENVPSQFLDQLAEQILRLKSEVTPKDILKGVGIGVPGRVDRQHGIALAASNLGWYNVPFAYEMSKRLGVKVEIDNDVRVYTLGESRCGVGKGYRDVICVTLGTGLAAGIMVGGVFVTGSNWFAGEIGHDFVPHQNSSCNCGRRGCLETIASATGIARLAEEAIKAGKHTSLRYLNREISAADVYQAAINGDQVSNSIFQFVGRELGDKLTTAVFLLNPDVIIIGGGVSQAGELLINPIKDRIYDRYWENNAPEVFRGSLGDSAGIYGAVHLLMDL